MKVGDYVRVPAFSLDGDNQPSLIEMSGTIKKIIETYDGVERHAPLYVVELEDGTIDSFTGEEFLDG